MVERFPLHQLKIITENEYKSEEVQKILKHKTEKGILWFLVKWKGLPVSEASWVDENNFDTKELVRKYLSKNPEKEKEEEIAERNRRSERVRVQRYDYLGNLIYLINLIILFMPIIAGKPVTKMVLVL